MRLSFAALALVLAGFLPSAVGNEASLPSTAAELEAFVTALGELAPDPELTGSVTNLTLTRKAAVFELSSGSLSALTIEGRVVGAVFDGKGSVSFEPQGHVERGQLERHLDASTLRGDLNRAVFLFTDDTWAQISPALQSSSGESNKKMGGFVRDALKYVVDGERAVADGDLLSGLVNDARPAIFHAHMDLADGPDVFYRQDDGSEEDVTFGRDGRGDSYDVINSFTFTGQDEASIPVSAGGGGGGTNYRAAEVVGYDIDVAIEEDLAFSAEANLFAFLNAPPGSWVPFSLAAALKVESVEWGGEPAQYLGGAKSSQLWVRAPESLSAGAASNVVFRYSGDIVDERRDWYILRSPTGWYPTTGATDATFDVRFKTHKKYKIMSAGTLASTEEEGDWVTTRWVVREPAPHSSFNVGDFDERKFSDDRVPPVTLHYSERAHKALGLITQKDMGEAVGADVVNSVAFFSEVFGPTPATEYNATEIPYFHGQAFSGMVQLSFVTFQWTGRDGAAEIFRAHEIAHQWWGIGVKPRTYHDTWLSEGLAEFSGLWYMQRVLMSSDRYLGHLEESRDNILKRRSKAGPVSLGPRLVTSETAEDYQIVVYEKGAWVIHMLRALMKDYETMSDDRFLAMLREFHQTNQGRSVTTDDFVQTVERHLGADMGWFFDQWVHGTEVPTYKWAVEGESLPSGEYKMRIRVDQSGVPEGFKMVIPIRLDFGDEGFAHTRILVEGSTTVTELPIMPREPDEIVFNDQAAVLAEVDRVRW